MELRAVIEGLRALKRPAVVELYSDSQYLLQGLRDWLPAWKARGWRTAGRKPVKNVEQWQVLDELLGRHEVRFHWVEGHSGHPDNERCDAMAVAAARAASAR